MHAVILFALIPAQPASYPNPQLLMEPEALAILAPGKAVIVDVRASKSYAAGHIPGAISVETATFSKAFASDSDPASWSRRLGNLGIDSSSTVVIYGDAWPESARAWWIMHYWGIEDVRLLNGGWSRWKASGGKVSTDEAKPTPLAGKAARREERVATKENMLKYLKEESCQIWDCRTTGEFTGRTGAAKRKGAIPGACHLDWSNLVDEKSQRLKPAAEIARLMADCGLDPKQPVVTYCQTGGRASIGAFVMELMGCRQVRNYYRSWAEWGNAEDTPVAKPEKK